MKQDKMLLKASLICFTVLSLSFLLMIPAPNGEEEGQVKAILTGICFWLSLIVGIVSQVRLSIRRRKWEKKTGVVIQQRIGLISFCRNDKGRLADLLLLLGVVGLAVSMWLTNSVGFACYIFLSITVLAFSAHCVYNGKNYNYLQIRKKIKSGRRARQRGITHEE